MLEMTIEENGRLLIVSQFYTIAMLIVIVVPQFTVLVIENPNYNNSLN